MCEAEREIGAQAFFVMDENFLLYKKRAMELLQLMKANGKAWSLYVFSSANAIRKYEPRELVQLGVEWIWLGLESSGSQYDKLKGTDTRSLVRDLDFDSAATSTGWTTAPSPRPCASDGRHRLQSPVAPGLSKGQGRPSRRGG